MTVSLYDVSVRSYLQTLEGVSVVLEKGRDHLVKGGFSLDEIVATSLYPDMKPFGFQVQALVQHSLDAFEAIMNGTFTPSLDVPERSFDELQQLVLDARESLRKAKPNEVNARASDEVVFQVGEFKLPFTAPNFVLSFSIPNLHFHATTCYDILRVKGVPLGKMDYMGSLLAKSLKK